MISQSTQGGRRRHPIASLSRRSAFPLAWYQFRKKSATTNMTTRRQRRSTKPLSFYGITFKNSAATIVPAKPLSESAQAKEGHTPDQITHPVPSEAVGKNIDTERA
ncbi:MAG TPA: hypothetical protein VGX75_07830 [bacterium]|nr:hypothetical protein [bacterium]